MGGFSYMDIPRIIMPRKAFAQRSVYSMSGVCYGKEKNRVREEINLYENSIVPIRLKDIDSASMCTADIITTINWKGNTVYLRLSYNNTQNT